MDGQCRRVGLVIATPHVPYKAHDTTDPACRDGLTDKYQNGEKDIGGIRERFLSFCCYYILDCSRPT